MTGFVFRFVTAGAIVGALPFVVGRFGPRVAAVMLLLPIITAYGLAVVGAQRGGAAMASVAGGSIKALPLVLVFLIAAYVGAKHGLPPVLALATAGLVWVFAAAALLSVTAPRDLAVPPQVLMIALYAYLATGIGWLVHNDRRKGQAARP